MKFFKLNLIEVVGQAQYHYLRVRLGT